jgi:predicted RNase H-like nuclease (RuvC/YqgF family)
MPVYHCELCQFTTPLKSNYTTHVSSQKHTRFVEFRDRVQPEVILEAPQIQPVDNVLTTQAEKVAEFVCKHCEQKFAFKQSMYRHIKNTCKKKEDPSETIRLMKIEMEKLNTELENQNQRLEEQQNKIDQLMKINFPFLKS